MLYTFDNAELDQAIISSIYGTFIKSPFDPELVQSALGNDNLGGYQQMRGEFHNKKQIALGGARIPHLFPGEDLLSVKSEHPSTGYAEFQKTVLRAISQATGLSEMQLSGNWADATYSSAKGALSEAWKTLERRRQDFCKGFAQPIFTCFAEESFEIDDLPLPSGAPEFLECRQAYSAAKWLGPGRGHIDASKEVMGSQQSIETGLSTLEDEAGKEGKTWEEVLDQRSIEIARFKELGIPVPSWGAPIENDSVVQKIG
jgi:lambda family phage portal protein